MADKKLFGQAEDNNPPLTDKIAFGTDTNNARNMTFQNLLAWLESKLGFFRTANNLSEGNIIQMRNNLDVLSSSTVYYNLAQKPDFNQVIYKGNTTGYTPTLDYEPATKKYVDDLTVFKQVIIDQQNPADNVSRVCCTWSRYGRVVTCCGIFYTDGTDAPDGNTAPPDLNNSSGRDIVAMPDFSSLGVTGIPKGVVAPTVANQDRAGKIYLKQNGLLAYLGNTDTSIGYTFNFTFIMT